jgi:integrase
MSPLRQALADYLAVRRSLGYKLAYPEHLLGQFIAYLEDARAGTVTTAHALGWATLPGGDAWWHAQRLSMARGFAQYLHTTDPAAEVPPAGLIPARAPRATPYLYSAGDITALIAAAGSLRSPLRAATYQTLIGLLTVTGMRVGEAIRLDRADFGPAAGVLTIRDSKFGKSRLVPLHPTTTQAISGYLRLRGRLHPGPSDPAVFISPAGTRLIYCNVHATWRKLVRTAGLQARSPHCRPRPHDLRHSFAVASLLDAYAAGQDGEATLALLSTYLGHTNPAHTYWYLSAAPELMTLAGHKLEHHLASRP